MRILGKTRHGLLADDPALAEQLKVGMVFQNGALFDSLTVGENVGFLLYEHTQLPRARIGVRTLPAWRGSPAGAVSQPYTRCTSAGSHT